MKTPRSKGDGTTGAWKLFSESVNKMGEEEAEKRRSKFLKRKKGLFDKKNKK
ncbi:MAG: hypothetical protein MJB14_14055 [Spirochaetes bacterium]|nr:hypothetical protein [Spirochaetota bacterium]